MRGEIRVVDGWMEEYDDGLLSADRWDSRGVETEYLHEL